MSKLDWIKFKSNNYKKIYFIKNIKDIKSIK